MKAGVLYSGWLSLVLTGAVLPAVAQAVPQIENNGVDWLRRSEAAARVTVVDEGVAQPEVWLEYWPDGGAVTSTVPLGISGVGTFSAVMAGLSPAATVDFRFGASNTAGAVWSDAASLTTLDNSPRNWYVSTNGTSGAGTNWTTALTDLQSAFDIMVEGDTLFAAGQTFAATPATDSAYLWRNVTNVALRGGYTAANDVDLPGARDSEASPTIIRPAAGNARVLTLIALSNAVIDQVTVRDGYHNPASDNARGGGVYLGDCRAVNFTNCHLDNNTARSVVSPYGGGLYLVNSHVAVTGGTLTNNFSQGTGNTTAYGGGVYVSGNSRLTLTGVIMDYNRVAGSYNGHGYGGAFYVASGGELEIRETVLLRNRSSRLSDRTTYEGFGGGGVNYGNLLMQNVLVADNYSSSAHSDGIFADGGTATLVNCTVVDNGNVGLRVGNGSMTVTNSIIWGHSGYDLHGFPTDVEGALPGVWYSCIEEPYNLGTQGCLSIEPLFVDRAHYHLQSTEGHVTNGFFSGGSWTVAAGNSPLIDRGDPTAVFSLEPEPNGGRINMGAYGGTAAASQTAAIEVVPPSLANPGAEAWGHRSAILRGEVTDSGGEIPDVWFLYWESGSAVTNRVNMGLKGAAFEVAVASLSSIVRLICATLTTQVKLAAFIVCRVRMLCGTF